MHTLLRLSRRESPQHSNRLQFVGSEGRASATRGSRWREAAPSGGRPAVCRPGSGNGDAVTGLARAAQGLFQFLHGTLLFFSFFTKASTASLPIFLPQFCFQPRSLFTAGLVKENKLVTFMMRLRTLLVEGEIQTSPNAEGQWERLHFIYIRFSLAAWVCGGPEK